MKLHDPSCRLKLPSLHFPLWRSRKSLCAPSRNMIQKAAIIQPNRHESREGGDRVSGNGGDINLLFQRGRIRASERARPLDETRRDTSVSGAKLSLQPQSEWAGRMEVICGASPTDRLRLGPKFPKHVHAAKTATVAQQCPIWGYNYPE